MKHPLLSSLCALAAVFALFTAHSQEASAQDKGKLTVTGVVIDELGETMIGAGVLVKNTVTSVTTNLDGEYSITVDAIGGGGVLIFSSIGYADQEVAVGGREVINVQMQLDQLVLEEVVVVGYGTQKRESVVGPSPPSMPATSRSLRRSCPPVSPASFPASWRYSAAASPVRVPRTSTSAASPRSRVPLLLWYWLTAWNATSTLWTPTTSHPSPYSRMHPRQRFTVYVSDDPAKGNVVLKSIFGLGQTITNTSLTDGTFKNSYTASLCAGGTSKVYGKLLDSVLRFEDMANQPLFTYDGANHYLLNNDPSNKTVSFTYDSTSPATLTYAEDAGLCIVPENKIRVTSSQYAVNEIMLKVAHNTSGGGYHVATKQ